MKNFSFALIALTFVVSGCARDPISPQPVLQIPVAIEGTPDPLLPTSVDRPPPVYWREEPAYAPPDSSRGAELFRKCAPCHSIRPDGKHGIGPRLFGVAGSKIAASDYRYSDALKALDNVWSDANLDAFLMLPRGFAPGNKMTFRGINNVQDRADLILFLKSQR